MSARDDYPDLPEGSSLADWDRLHIEMCDEIDRLRELLGEDAYEGTGDFLLPYPFGHAEFLTNQTLDFAVGDVFKLNFNGEAKPVRVTSITPVEHGMFRYTTEPAT